MSLVAPSSQRTADGPSIEDILRVVIAGYAHMGITYEGIADPQRYDRDTTRVRLVLAALLYGFGYTVRDLAKLLHASTRTAYRYLDRAAKEMTKTSDVRGAVDFFYRLLVQRQQALHDQDEPTPAKRIRGVKL